MIHAPCRPLSVERRGRGVAVRRHLVLLCLMLVGADIVSAESAGVSSTRSTPVVLRWTALGAGGGFGLGAYLGVAFFDDAVNSDRKFWASAIVGSVAGGIGGYLIGRQRGRKGPSAVTPPVEPARVVALRPDMPSDHMQSLRGTGKRSPRSSLVR